MKRQWAGPAPVGAGGDVVRFPPDGGVQATLRPVVSLRQTPNALTSFLTQRLGRKCRFLPIWVETGTQAQEGAGRLDHPPSPPCSLHSTATPIIQL